MYHYVYGDEYAPNEESDTEPEGIVTFSVLEEDMVKWEDAYWKYVEAEWQAEKDLGYDQYPIQ